MSVEQKISIKYMDELENAIFGHFRKLGVEIGKAQEMIDVLIKFFAYGAKVSEKIINDHLMENGLAFVKLEGELLDLIIKLYCSKADCEVKLEPSE